jgi:Putative auto-transporter adhesin, head GIN domain
MFLVGMFMFFRKGSGCHFGGFGSVKGKGPIKTETRDLSSFNSLSIECSGNVEIIASETFRVELSAQENLLSFMESEVKGNTLKLDFKDNLWSSEPINIKVYVPNLEEISLGGSANIVAKLPLSGEKLDLSVGGSGNIEVGSADFKKVVCAVGGSGNINVSGKTESIEASISGSGGVDSQNLVAQTGEASISGSGTVTCNISQKLEASISGSGEVQYKGSPEVETSVSGSGSVSKI